ncbi:hypothetical protein I4U23_002564 [Adineta vaga]|nr:hypothetical protein I4U23_002564 [Adineta vaga]
MARRADWDVDDFEILSNTSTVNLPQTSEIIYDDGFEIVINKNKSTDTNFVASIIEKANDEVKPQSPHYIRYGSAADIPFENSFDYKSILSPKPILSSNNIMTLIRANQSEKSLDFKNNLNDVLIDYTRDRENLIRMAKQRQQDFIKAMRLD